MGKQVKKSALDSVKLYYEDIKTNRKWSASRKLPSTRKNEKPRVDSNRSRRSDYRSRLVVKLRKANDYLVGLYDDFIKKLP